MNAKKTINGKVKRGIMFLFDVFCFVLVDILYHFATKYLDGSPTHDTGTNYIYNSLILFGTMFTLRFLFRVYINVWRYTNTQAYFNLVVADFTGSVVAFLLSRAIFSTYVGIWQFSVVASLTALSAIMSRLAYRLLYKHLHVAENTTSQIRVAIVGAGQIGASLAGDLTCSNASNYKPVMFIDKDRQKVGNRVYGIPVYFENTGVLEIIKNSQIQEIFIALADVNSEEASRLYEFYSLTGCKIKIYDTPMRDADGAGNGKRTIREFSIEDLLFREPLNVSGSEAFAYYGNKTVLVTGGGGSIGSELCRQIAKCNPKKLVILDI